jgi:DNA-directed RNA polymerase specialized sigma24 family protein
MPSNRPFARLHPIAAALLGGAIAVSAGGGNAAAQITPQTVQLLNRLCAQTLRTNEEDRLYGMISLTVRATLRYRGAELRPDLIDDAVQDSLDAMIEDCPELTEEDESKRLTMAVEMISDATTKDLEDLKAAQKSGDKDSPYPNTPPEKLTAADLSEELSSQEIDQWLDSMPPRQRALSLFLYASDVTPREIAEAVGEPPGALSRQFAASKNDLMRIFREEYTEPVPVARTGPAMAFTESGTGFSALMKANAPPAPAAAPVTAPAAGGAAAAASAPASDPATSSASDPPADGTSAYQPAADSLLPSLQVTGISDDLYSGWSLLATGRNLAQGQRIAINEPFVLEPANANIKRMLVVDIAEIGDPRAATRHFLLKAYALDAEKEAAGLHDGFHVGAPLNNEEAKKTLANTSLSSIEVARCLWHDFGTAGDPGLCR